MAATTKDGSLSIRSTCNPKVLHGVPLLRHSVGTQSQASHNFLKHVNRTTDAFIAADNAAVEDVRRVLPETRQQYDAIHQEAQKKEEKLRKVKDAILVADSSEKVRFEEFNHLEELRKDLEEKHEETQQKIHETQTSKKVYEHMLARMQKEQAILKQKMLKMEQHLARKTRELQQTKDEGERLHTEKVRQTQHFLALETDRKIEMGDCKSAREAMEAELKRRKSENEGRAELQRWRGKVALEAANEAFNASAGRLRKLCAIEKLAGNSLQKMQDEQNGKSRETEAAFKRLRDVTGLNVTGLDDNMNHVRKVLEQHSEQQLPESVKEAEVRLEKLRQEYDAVKKETEGMAFDPAAVGHCGDLYKETEQHQQKLHDAMKEHEGARLRLQRATMQVEQMKRWTKRVGDRFADFDEPIKVETPADLPLFFQRIEVTIQKWVARISKLLAEGKFDTKGLEHIVTQTNQVLEKRLADKNFLKANCRIDLTVDARPVSRQGGTEDGAGASMTSEREAYKEQLADYVNKEKGKKRGAKEK